MTKYERLYIDFCDAQYDSKRAKVHDELYRAHLAARECATSACEKYSDEWYQAWYEGLGVIVTSRYSSKRLKNWFAVRGFCF